ncbi:MAG: CotH kinase family protein [Nannocystaceae bacterium]|nr:CotH kinase family protein [Nannocystaceae bacterium]
MNTQIRSLLGLALVVAAIGVVLTSCATQSPAEEVAVEEVAVEEVPAKKTPPDEVSAEASASARSRRGGSGMHKRSELVTKFDADADGHLNPSERALARASMAEEESAKSDKRRHGPRRGKGAKQLQPPGKGIAISQADVKSYSGEPLYDPSTVRTLFLEFENPLWEEELEEFYRSDVEVPATLMVDGASYRNVGVHFRGNSSFMMIPSGSKRPVNLSMNDIEKGQRLYGYKTLNLLNSVGDPTFLRAVLYSHIAQQYLVAPKANYVRLVVNAEDWGIYISQEQFNKDFTSEHFATKKGARWKVPGSPHGQGTLAYLGDEASAYSTIYTIKSKDRPESWAKLALLCKVLNETSPDQLEKALEPLFDVDGALRFLAVENALINSDGYWTRASDYNLAEDSVGRIHIVPYDVNEGFTSPHHGRGAEPEGEKYGLDPLVAAEDASKPLISKLLAVPTLRARYLGYVREIADKWLDWETLGPLAAMYQGAISEAVKVDNKKLYATEAF